MKRMYLITIFTIQDNLLFILHNTSIYDVHLRAEKS